MPGVRSRQPSGICCHRQAGQRCCHDQPPDAVDGGQDDGLYGAQATAVERAALLAAGGKRVWVCAAGVDNSCRVEWRGRGCVRVLERG